jgi:FHS family glucose/mannose:H+ symporter-like MFS transporter
MCRDCGRHRDAFGGLARLGGGLGLTMTSVSLLQSRRHAGKRAAELARLNLIWSLGACAAPSLLLRGAAHWTLWPVLLAASALFLALGAAAAFLLREPQAPSVPAVAAATAGAPRATRLPWLLLAIIPLTTGVESSLGGWLSTYSRRAGLLTAGIANTVTCFWLGLLLGRLVFSIPQLAARWQRATLVFAPCLLALSIACLLTLHGAVSLAACALMAGAAVGPLYPLALALRLEHGEAGNLPFLIAGCGAAALPLLTGVVSDATRSLTHGLLVPLWGAAAMALLATMAAAALRGNTDPARSA